VRRPSDEAEALAVARAKARELAARGFDALRPLAGEVRATVLGVQLVGGGDAGEVGETVADSGALYHWAASVNYGGDDAVEVEVSVQADEGPGEIFYAQWILSRDGTLTRDY
jgi:hypothetical protein